MSIIIWDGKTIAADKQMTGNGIIHVATKIFKVNDKEVVAFNGALDQAYVLFEWYKNGCVKDDWPDFQSSDEWTGMVVATQNTLQVYQRYYLPITYEDKYLTFGAGREIALGALSMGADAIKAVKIVCLHESSCGCGIDAYTFVDDKIVYYGEVWDREVII